MNSRDWLKAILCATLILVTASWLGAPYALAQNNQDKPKISQAQAIAKAQQRIGGRILRVEQTATDYRIKMLQQSGRVVSVEVNSLTGRVKQAHSNERKKER